MKKFDTLQRFIFEHANIRGEIVHLGNTFTTIINQHPYPPLVKNLLGEALVSCLLLASTIKFEGEISLQFNGDKRLPLLLVQCTNNLTVRACAKYQEPENEEQIDYNSAFLAGKMIITINQVKKTNVYQSIVPINSTSMSENIMNYFAQSEQISTKIWIAVGDEYASGMLLQLMPEQNSIKREEFWEYAVHIGQTISNDELLQLDTETILYRLYHETELRLFELRDVQFKCKCSSERMKQAVSLLGKKDVEKLLKERGLIDITCDFCNTQYTFDSIDIALLFQ